LTEREILHARQQARQQLLEEQAERQRLRAPEPVEWHGEELPYDDTDADVERVIVAIAVVILVIVALVFGAWPFWIGMLAAVIVVPPLVVRASR
jgi:hypothetical protein